MSRYIGDVPMEKRDDYRDVLVGAAKHHECGVECGGVEGRAGKGSVPTGRRP